MEKKINKSGVIEMALLYAKKYSDSDTLPLDKINTYGRIINENLNMMGSPYFLEEKHDQGPQLYNLAFDENKNMCAIIDEDADFEAAWWYYISFLPMDVVVAAQKANALHVIGLDFVDGKILKRKASASNNAVLVKK